MNNHICIRKLISFMLCIIIVVVFTSCTAYDVSVADYAPADENKLVIYTSHKEEVYGPIVREFEERTGIWVEVVAGGTNEMLEKIVEETDENTCDIMFGGGVESLDAYSEYFISYESGQSEFLDGTFRSADKKWTVFSSLPIVIIYNNKLVYETSAPAGWSDLLNDEWKGKIAFADPYNSGTSVTALATMIQLNDYDSDEIIWAFSENVDGDILAGSGEVSEAVASGTKLVGITLEETALKQIAGGADITMVYPVEGTSAVPDGIAIVNHAPHEENAKLFLDFVVGSDAQRLLVNEFYRRSVRIDIPIPSHRTDIEIVDFNLDWASENQSNILEKWTETISEEETE